MNDLRIISDDNDFSYFTKNYHSNRSFSVFGLVLLFLLAIFISLPLVRTTISVKSLGLTRPHNERTEIKPVLSGIIDSLLVKEGDTVKQGQLLATIKDNVTEPKPDKPEPKR